MLALCVMMSVVVPSCALTVSNASITRIPVLESSAPCRLITKQDVGPLGDCARYRDALLFATGQLGRKVAHAVLQSDERQRLLGAHGVLGDLGDESDIFARRQARYEIVELKHEAHVFPAVGREAAIVEPGQLQFIEEEMAAGRAIESSHDVQERRLSASRRAEHHDHFSGGYLKVQIMQRTHFNLA